MFFWVEAVNTVCYTKNQNSNQQGLNENTL